MKTKINKDELKNLLTIDQVADFVASLGGDPRMMNNFFISHTICHNPPGTGSYKLYYYENTHLFCCYTDCGERFDIYELTLKVKKMAGFEWSLPRAIAYVASYFGYSAQTFDFDEEQENLKDWDFIKNYEKINSLGESQIVEMKILDPNVLQNFPHPRIIPWEQEGITKEVMESRGICYDPAAHGIIIPHYDKDNNLIGIRERTLVKEEEEYGKYRPAVIGGVMYNHPLTFNLYNLNNSKDAIRIMKKVIVFESEKSCLKYASFFGKENDISVAVCGSNLITYQLKLLLQLGVEEVIIAFDRQYKEIGDKEYQRWVKKLNKITEKYRAYVTISYMFDTEHKLGYKDAPIDLGSEVFLDLFQNRLNADGR